MTTYMNDTTITFKAKSVMTAIINAGENFGRTIQDICALCGIGVYAARTAVIELEKAGYIKRKRERRSNGTLGGMQYVLRKIHNCTMPSHAKIIPFCSVNVNYEDEEICSPKENTLAAAVGTSESSPVLSKNTQPDAGQNGFIKPSSPMLGFPILGKKEKQEKEKRSKKEKEKKEKYIKQTNTHVRKKLKEQINYEGLLQDSELNQKLEKKKVKVYLDLVLRIMLRSCDDETISQVDSTYVKGFVLHICAKKLRTMTTAPLRYFSAAFINYGTERYFIDNATSESDHNRTSCQVGPKAAAPMAENVPATEQNVSLPEEQEQLQEEEQWLLSLPENELERELDRKKDYYDVMYPEGSKVRARYNNLLAAIYVHKATDHSFTDGEALLIYEWERRRLNAELRYRSDGWISQDLRSLYLQTNSKLGTNEKSSRRVGYLISLLKLEIQKMTED